MAKMQLDIDLNPNVSQAGLKNAKQKIKDGFDGTDVTVEASIQTNEIMAQIEALKQKLKEGVKLGVDTSEFERELDELENLSRKSGEKTGDAIKEGVESKVRGINIGKVFSAQVLSDAVNQLGDSFNSVSAPFIAFDKQLADLSAVTGQSGATLDLLGEKARALALRFGGDAAGQIESFKGVLSRLGPDIAKSPEALEKMGAAINTVAKASGLEATEAMDALTTSMLQFGVDVSDPVKAAGEMEKMMNVLAAGAKVGAAEIPQVAQAVAAAGVAAKGANLSFEETNASLQVLAAGGKYGAEAGTALRNVLGYLQKQSGEGEKTLASMGLTIEQLGESLTTNGLASTMELLGNGINKLGTDAQKNAAMMQLFGTENAAAATMLMKGADTTKAWTKEMTGTNTAFEQAAINMDTVASKTELFKAKMEDLAITIGQKLGAAGTTAASSMIEVGKVITAGIQIKSIIPEGLFNKDAINFTNFSKKIKDSFGSIKGMAKDMGGAFSGVFTPIISQSGDLVKALLTKIVPSFFVTTTATTASGAAATTTAFSFTAMWEAMSGPIGWVITGIVAVGAAIWALYTYCEPVRNAIDGLFSGIADVFKSVWSGIVGVFSSLWDTLKPIFTYIGDALAAVGIVLAVVLIAPYKILWELLKAVGSWVADVFVKTWTGLKESLSAFGVWIGTAFTDVWNGLINAMKFTYSWITDIFISAWDTLVSTLTAVGDFIVNSFNIAWAGLGTAISGVGNYISGAFMGIWNALSGAFKSFTTFLSGAFTTVWNWLQSAFGAVIAPIKLAGEGVKYLTASFQKASSVGIYVKGVIAGLTAAFGAFGESIAAMWNSLVNLDFGGFSNAFSGMAAKVVTAFKGGMDKTIESENKQAAALDAAEKKAANVAKQNQINAKNQAKNAENQSKAAKGLGSADDALTSKSVKNSKSKSDAAKKASEDILKLYAQETERLNKANETRLIKEEQARTEAGLAKTTQDSLNDEVEKWRVLAKQKDMLDAIAKKAGGEIKNGIVVGTNLSADAKEKLQNEVNKVVSEMDKSGLAMDGLMIQVGLDEKSVSEARAKLAIEVAKDDLQFNLKAGVITNIEFNSGMVEQLQKELNLLLAKKSELEQKIEVSIGTTNETKLREELNKVQDSIRKIQEQSSDYQKKNIEATQLASIQAIQNRTEREYQLETYNLARTYDEKLKKARESGEDTYKITDEYLQRESELTEKYNQAKASSYEKTQVEIMSILGNTFSNLNLVKNDDSISAAKSQLESLAGERSELDKAYKDGEKSYAEYVSALNELDDQRAEAQKKANQNSIDLMATMNQALSRSFGDIANASQAAFAQSNIDKDKAVKRSAAAQKKMDSIQDKSSQEYLDLLKIRDDATADAVALQSAAWAQLGTAVGGTFAQMFADGSSFLKATVTAALKGLQAMVPIWSAQILGGSLATPQSIMTAGGWGLAQWAAMTAILEGVVGAAIAAVGTLKFEKGGLIPAGEKLITVNEKGQEIVMNHVATGINKEALLEINRRNISIEQYARERGYTSVIGRTDNTGIESRLDNIEMAIMKTAKSSTIKAESKVSLEINDRALVERVAQKKRSKVRSF